MNPLPIASRHSKRLAPYRPPVRAWYGAVMATGLVVYAAVIFLSTQVNTPLGILGDMGVSVLALAGLTLLAGGLGAGLLALVARVPPLWGGAVTGLAGALAVYLWLTRGSVPEAVLGFLLVLPPAVLGGALGLGLERGFRRAGVALLLLAALGLNGAELYWLAGSGAPAHTVAQPAGVTPAALRAPDPREPGGFEVKTLTYGSGTDRREAYGSGVALRTEPVDASPFLGEWSGRQGALRTWHWGFDATQVPINGRVWYPSGEGPFPLVLFVHGNHDMTAQSEAGYGYLAELLASRGYIVASVDENYLNGGWAGDMGGRENAARAWVLLQHLEAFQRFHTTAGSPFFRRVDLAHIGLVGHSRGGEAAYLAAVFNNLPNWPDDATVPFQFQFAIRAVAAIAPVDGQYRPGGQAASLENVSYLVLQGAGDSDVSAYMGIGPYQRTRFTDGEGHFKAGVYIYGANHGQFNTEWGRRNWSGLPGLLVATRPVMSGEAQRQAATVYLSAFLDATLRERSEYLPLFQDHRTGMAWLPDTVYVSHFADASFRPVSTFDEDLDVLTTTAPGGVQSGDGLAGWREERPPLRRPVPQANSVLRLEWRQDGASYSIALPDHLAREWNLGATHALTFALADGRAAGAAPLTPLDLTVELTSADGLAVRAPLSRWASVGLPQPVGRLYKLGALEDALLGPPAPVLQTYMLPLSDFANGTGFEPAQLRTVTFRFDRSPAGTLLLDDVGFSQVRQR